MTPFLALLWKQIMESRWTLVLSALTLFVMGLPCVYWAGKIESGIRDLGMNELPDDARQFQQYGGPDMDLSSAAIEVLLWNHPFIVLTVALWGISRGSAAISAEIEHGTLDILLSRPISRGAYLSANVIFSIVGFATLGVALVGGNKVMNRFFAINTPPSVSLLTKPALNLMALGLAIYGFTIAVSSMASVRWKPIMVATSATLASYIIHVLVNLPMLDEWKRYDRFTIFHAFNPVELVTKGQTFNQNMVILSAIAAGAIAVAYLIFAFRDLPANS